MVSSTPPKPRVALRIGITGHRPDKLSPAIAAQIEPQLTAAFRQIAARLDAIRNDHPATFSQDAIRLSLVTALAEGADRVAAHAAAACGLTIEAVLPFPREVFQNDFTSAESKKEFDKLIAKAAAVLEFDTAGETLGTPDEATSGYAAAGLMMLRQCDLLVAIWNGKPASGPAGTAEVVEAARRSGIPCLWYDSATGAAKFRNAKPRQIDTGADANDWLPLMHVDIDALVNGLVLPPPATNRGRRAGIAASQGSSAERYLKETLPPSNGVFFAYPLLVDVLHGKWQNVLSPWKSYISRGQPGIDPAKGWGEAYWRVADAAFACNAPPLRAVLEQRYLWADQLALYYGQRYRSTYVTLFLLAPLIVACALIGLVLDEMDKPTIVLSIVEPLLIAAMVLLGGWGRDRNWHQLWIDYRQLAEMLRHARILVLTGSSLPEMHTTPEPGTLGAGTQWVQWYYRATIRELGLCGARLDRAHAEKVAGVVRECELAEQIKFHEDNALHQHRIEHRLEDLGIGMLTMSAFATFLHIAIALATFEQNPANGEGIVPLVKHLALFLSIALPAFGAALFAIRAQGDFGGVAHRAEAMATHLTLLDQEIADQQKAGITITLLAACADAAADTMLSEVSQWRQIFFSKRLALPA